MEYSGEEVNKNGWMRDVRRLKREVRHVDEEDETEARKPHRRRRVRCLEDGGAFYFSPTAQIKSALITAASHCC